MAVDRLSVSVGSVRLRNPVLAASGTAGHGAELGAYVDLARLGGVVVKSLSAAPWAGNPPPRLHGAGPAMLNSVGLQGPGVTAWIEDDLPALQRAGATVIASIWGRTVADYEAAAALLAGVSGVSAVEVNLSCPNLEGGRHLFAHDPGATAEAIEAAAAAGLPRWAKLSPNTDRVVEVAGAARDAGADAVVVANTVLGMVLDIKRFSPVLATGGGLSGPAVHAIAVRAVWDVHAAHPDFPIVGVGGVRDTATAIELLQAGAAAVEVGTATLLDPRATAKVLAGVDGWLVEHDTTAAALVGRAHG